MTKGLVSSNKIIIFGFAVFLRVGFFGFFVGSFASSQEEKIATPSVTPSAFSTLAPTSKPINIKKLAPEELSSLFAKYSAEYNVSEQVLRQIAWCESKFNSRAVSGAYGGMYQFTPTAWFSTRRAMGLGINPDLRFNPEEAIKTAAFKIARDGTAAWPVCGR